MGLYGQRVGCLSFLFDKPEYATNAISQLKIIARPIYSSPPLHGARVVELVLGVPALYDLWLKVNTTTTTTTTSSTYIQTFTKLLCRYVHIYFFFSFLRFIN